MAPKERETAFWVRFTCTVVILAVPWGMAVVRYGANWIVMAFGVTVSGALTLLVWDGTRIARTMLAWLRGEPLRDRTTGVYNEAGWRALLDSEEDRCRRYELEASVVVIQVARADGGDVRTLGSAIAETLRSATRGHDVVACLAPDTYAILAVLSKQPNADSLIARIRPALDSLGLTLYLGVGSRTGSSSLQAAFTDAKRGLMPASS